MPKKHRPHLDNLVDTSAHRLSFWHSVVCPSDSAHSRQYEITPELDFLHGSTSHRGHPGPGLHLITLAVVVGWQLQPITAVFAVFVASQQRAGISASVVLHRRNFNGQGEVMLSALIMPRPAQSTFPQLKIFSAKHRFHGSPKSANNANAPVATLRVISALFFTIENGLCAK
jgi:hypothetical protein